MDYAHAVTCLQNRAKFQGRYKTAFRNVYKLHHHYTVQLHGTHRWVTKKQWNALPTMNERLNLSNYPKYVSDRPTADYNYAVLVPNAPISLKVYNTDVAVMHADGSVVLNTNDWRGYFTLKWMNTLRYVNIRSTRLDKWTPMTWCLTDSQGITSKFYDGLTIDKDGKIISDIIPANKHVIDRSKSKAWYEAAKHLRNQALPYLAMLEGNECPAPVLEQMKDPKNNRSDAQFIEYIMSKPEEYDPLVVTQMALRRWYRTSSSHWATAAYETHRMDHAISRFEGDMRVLYRTWARENALKERV